MVFFLVGSLDCVLSNEGPSEFLTSVKWEQNKVFPHRRRKSYGSCWDPLKGGSWAAQQLIKNKIIRVELLKCNTTTERKKRMQCDNSHIRFFIVWFSPLCQSFTNSAGLGYLHHLPAPEEPACMPASSHWTVPRSHDGPPGDSHSLQGRSKGGKTGAATWWDHKVW